MKSRKSQVEAGFATIWPMQERCERLRIDPLSAVADAMMVAVYRQIEFDLRHFVPSNGLDEEMEEVLKKATASGCRLGSAYALEFLYEGHRAEFTEMLMVETHSSKNWLWHDYFLVQGVDGVWYAGSPANYGRGTQERTTNLINGRCLNKVMRKIEKVEEGEWPTAQQIEGVLLEQDSKVIICGEGMNKVMSYLCVSKKESGVVGERCLIRI